MARITSKSNVTSATHACHFHRDNDVYDGFSTGCFLNLGCGHNNQYSFEERKQLLSFLNEACETCPDTLV